MTTRSKALISVIREQWTDKPAGAAAIQIINGIEAQQAPAAEWSCPDILGLLGPGAALHEVIPALAILTQSEMAIFSSFAVFVDENMQSHRLSARMRSGSWMRTCWRILSLA